MKRSYPRYFVPTVPRLWSCGGSYYCYCVKVNKPGEHSVLLNGDGSQNIDEDDRWSEEVWERKVKTKALAEGSNDHSVMKEVTEAEFVLMDH